MYRMTLSGRAGVCGHAPEFGFVRCETIVVKFGRGSLAIISNQSKFTVVRDKYQSVVSEVFGDLRAFGGEPSVLREALYFYDPALWRLALEGSPR
jgi:hypothetical protein